MDITQQLLTAMPKVDGWLFSDQAVRYANEITRPDRSLYASKPTKASPEGRYIWRMVVYLVSPRAAHQCMPVTASFELGPYHEIKPLLARLDRIADQIVDAIPVDQWHGVRRYASILG